MIIEPHPPLTRAWIPNERKRVSLPFYESSLSYNKPQASLIVKTCIETLLKCTWRRVGVTQLFTHEIPRVYVKQYERLSHTHIYTSSMPNTFSHHLDTTAGWRHYICHWVLVILRRPMTIVFFYLSIFFNSTLHISSDILKFAIIII